jgi:hypothetical protein
MVRRDHFGGGWHNIGPLSTTAAGSCGGADYCEPHRSQLAALGESLAESNIFQRLVHLDSCFSKAEQDNFFAR